MVEAKRARSRQILERLLQDLDRAGAVADGLAAQGRLPEALEILFAILQRDPYRASIRRRYVANYFAAYQDRYPVGSPARSRILLYLLGFDATVPEVEAAYFDNLDRLLAGRPRRAAPGRLVLGLGSGRCGSTGLAALIAGAADSCATHENPMPLHWHPQPAQLAFHERRFERLLAANALVFDAAHWWLNGAEAMIARFAETKLLGLIREPAACARSFLAIKGLGRHSINHWVDHDGSFWKKALWDNFYPSYELNLPAGAGPDAAAMEPLQRRLLRRYLDDYNAALRRLAARLGHAMLLVETERLHERAAQDEIQDFLGLRLPYRTQIANRGTTKDGTDEALRF